MFIRSDELKKGKKLRKVFYRDGAKHYAEIKVEKIYSYKMAHSRDLRKRHTQAD